MENEHQFSFVCTFIMLFVILMLVLVSILFHLFLSFLSAAAWIDCMLHAPNSPWRLISAWWWLIYLCLMAVLRCHMCLSYMAPNCSNSTNLKWRFVGQWTSAMEQQGIWVISLLLPFLYQPFSSNSEFRTKGKVYTSNTAYAQCACVCGSSHSHFG